MSISKQVKELREKANYINEMGTTYPSVIRLLNEAADTIEFLSAKLQAVNMERSERYYGGGWILCNAENLPDEEVLCCDNHGEVILGYVFEDETSDTGFSAESDHEYMYGCVKWMEKPKP